MKLFWKNKEIKELRNEIEILDGKIETLTALLDKKPDKIDKDTHERIAELEVKMAKLWSILLESDARGKDKATKLGRLFGRKL